MKIDLTVSPSELIEIFVNDKLAGEVCVGALESTDTLRAEVNSARSLRALPILLDGLFERWRTIRNIEDHVNTTEVQKRDAFMRGLLDGWSSKTVPYLLKDLAGQLPPLPPEHTGAYRTGYEHGEALARVKRHSEATGARGQAVFQREDITDKEIFGD